MEMTIQQKQALAIASARMRMSQSEKPDGGYIQPAPPPGVTIHTANGPMYSRGNGVLEPTTLEKAQARAEGQLPFSGSVLPVSADAQGNASFDSNAGILGTMKRAFKLMSGQTPIIINEDGSYPPETIGQLMEAALVFSPMGAATRASGLPLGVPTFKSKPYVKPPSAQALKEAADMGYKNARRAGVEYTSDGVKTVAEAALQRLREKGLIDATAPSTIKVLNELASPPPGSFVTASDIISARQVFNKLGRQTADGRPTPDAVAAGDVSRGLGVFLQRPPEGTVRAGAGKTVGKLVREADQNYAASLRSNKLNGIAENADNRAAAANSGLNLDNTIRQRVADLLDPNKSGRLRGFSQEEVAALKQVNRGTASRNTLRFVGNRLGGLTSTALAGAGGAYMAGPTGALLAGVPTALGYSAKEISNILARRSLGAADKMVRSRSPLYQNMLADLPVDTSLPAGQQAVLRALLAYGGATNPRMTEEGKR